jgi:hypothetical protein
MSKPSGPPAKFIIVVMVAGFALIHYFEGQLKASLEECEKRGGTFLMREQACIKAEGIDLRTKK